MRMQKKKILVIDDDETILQVVQIILEGLQYEVVTSPNGKCVYGLNGLLPDLIILDVLLSGEDGREICRYLKSQQKTRDIPVILFSAHADMNKTVSAAGADYFLPKPFEVDALADAVAKHMERHNNSPPS